MTSETVRTDGTPVFVADDPESVPDGYGEAPVVDDWPSPVMVKVKIEAVGDTDPAPVTELPDVCGADAEAGETGIVRTVAEPDGNVTVMTVGALVSPPVGRTELDEVPP